jgi:hypothetical protein
MIIFTSNHLFFIISIASFVAFSHALSQSKHIYILCVSLFIIDKCLFVSAVPETATLLKNHASCRAIVSMYHSVMII